MIDPIMITAAFLQYSGKGPMQHEESVLAEGLRRREIPLQHYTIKNRVDHAQMDGAYSTPTVGVYNWTGERWQLLASIPDSARGNLSSWTDNQADAVKVCD
ncbi:hypothetical protein [Nocardia sp. NPDC006630]|uniref:hypothetical protein n=1 Tax=Nocardia sp. NPDC006630 TaxID=3157181 RepID=UPI0033A4D5A0